MLINCQVYSIFKRKVLKILKGWRNIRKLCRHYLDVYKNCSSYSSRDFLLRLYYLVNKEDFLIQTDNGSEFSKYFQKACEELNITHYYSRVNTPKDNAQIERFNRTREEFLQLGNYIDDVKSFNNLLGEWLIEYNFNRPHQSVGYLTPIEFLEKKKGLDKNNNIWEDELDENEKFFTVLNLYKGRECQVVTIT